MEAFRHTSSISEHWDNVLCSNCDLPKIFCLGFTQHCYVVLRATPHHEQPACNQCHRFVLLAQHRSKSGRAALHTPVHWLRSPQTACYSVVPSLCWHMRQSLKQKKVWLWVWPYGKRRKRLFGEECETVEKVVQQENSKCYMWRRKAKTFHI